MKIKTFILTFLMMSCSIVFGQGTYSESAKTEAQIMMHLANDEVGTITIANNISIGNTIEILNGRKVTIDLNGHELSTNEEIYIFKNFGKLTITDSDPEGKGTIIAPLGIYNGKPQTRTISTDINYNAQLTINGGKFVSTSSNVSAAIYNHLGVINIRGGEFYGEYSAITNYGMANIENTYIECLNRDNGAAAIINDFEIEYGENVRIVGRYTTATETGVITPSDYKPTYLFAELDGTKYPSLQAALDACTTGDNTINLLFHNSDNATVSQKEGVNITIDGNGYKGKQFEYTGTIYVNGNSRHTGAETLTIQDVDFYTEKDTHDFISCNSGSDPVIRYAHNVTVQNCNFNAKKESTAVVALRFRQSYNINVKDSEFTNLHSAMWATGTSGIAFDNIEATKCKEGGISAGTSTPVSVKNSTIEGAKYGVRADGSGAYSLTVENSTLEAEVPVIVRNTTGDYNLTVKEDATLTATNGGPQVVVTDSDNKPYVVPTSDVNVTLYDNVTSTFGLTAKIGNAFYATLQDAVDNAKTGETVTLIADNCKEDVTVTQAPNYAITIDGAEKTFKGTITVDGKSARYETTALTIKNVNFDATEGISADACINLGVSGNNNTRYTNKVTVENCTFTDNDYSSVAIKSYTGGDRNLVVKDCEANGMHSLAQLKNIEQGLVISGNIANTKNGINLNQTAVGTIVGNEINVKGYAVRIGESTGGNITLNENTLKTDNTEGDPVIELRGTVVALNMEKNVVSGNTHIKGTAGTISVDANYWDGKEAPVVAEGSAPIVVNSYYSDATLSTLVRNEMGSIYAFVSSDRIFGDVTTNAKESIKIEIIGKDGNPIGTSSLEKTEHATGFNKQLTWRINLGDDDSDSWAMAWEEGCPSINNMPAKVKLYVDAKEGDAAVAEAEIKYTANGDGQSPVFAAKTNAEGKINSFIACTGEFNLSKAANKLVSASADGDNIAILVAGTYNLPTGKNLTITGAVNDVQFGPIGTPRMDGNYTFNNVTFNYAADSHYKGLQHAGDMIYNNCTFNGQVFLYGESETFNNCTFNQEDSNNYNVWTYGAKEVAFNECTFNSAGKSVLIYKETTPGFVANVSVDKCEFNATTAVEGKAAIEMDSSLTDGINLTIDDETTATGFGSGNASGNSLWNNKKGNNDDANNDITVVVAGETVLEPVYEAQIEDKKFRNLKDAFAAATEEQTITLLGDATPALTSQRAITKAPVIDLNDNTLTLAEDDLYFGTTTFKNGSIVVDPSVKASTAVFWMFANQTLTFDNVKLTATGVTGTYLIGINGGTGSNVNLLNGTNIIINNESQAGLSAVICDNGTGNNVIIEDSYINVNNIEGRFYLGGTSGNITVDNTDIDLNGVKEGFYLRVNQTLSIGEDTTIDVVLNETEGRYGINFTDVNYTYTVDETATVNATVYEPVAIAQIGTIKYPTLQGAIDAVKDGETIELLADCAEAVTFTQTKDVSFELDGKNKTYTGSINITARAGKDAPSTLVIKDFNFKTDKTSHDFIKSVEKNYYPNNITIIGCSFEGTSDINTEGYAVVAVRLRSANNIKIEDCTGTGLHSFLQNTAGWNLTIDDVDVNGAAEGGFALGTVQGVTVKNCEINSGRYGIRLDGQYNNNAVIADNTIDAFIPVVVRKASVDGAITFDGTNVFTQRNTDGYWCVIGTEEYNTNGALPSAATAKINVTLNDTGLDRNGIYGNYGVAKINKAVYNTFADALNAVQDGQTITVLNVEGSEINKEIEFTKDIEFTITGEAPNYALPVVTFQNATVNIKDAEILIPELDARQNATINVINSTVYDAGGNSIAKSYYNGALNISGNSKVYMMQVTTMGYINISDNAQLHATWQTNVYGNGLITLNEGATFATAGLNLIAKEYSGRDNTDAGRVGKPAEIVVNGANFTVGKVYSASGADYSYNADGYGINVGTIEGKSAILTIKNGGNVNIYTGNGKTANIGADGTVNIDASTFNVVCRAENGTATLASNGTVNVTGASNLAAANVTGNGWFYMNGVTLDANTKLLGAKVRFASGTNNIDGSTINDGFFQVGIGAYNGVDANVDTENGVVVNVKNAVVGANGDTYAGWAGTGFYDTDDEKAAAMTNAKYVLNIENSIAEFGYLHVSNDGELNVKGDAAEKKWYNNSDYSFYAGEVIINGKATFDATDVLAFYTKVSCDNDTDNPGTLNIVNGTEYEAERHNGAVAGLNFDIRKTGIVNVAEGADLHVGEPASIAADATMNIGGTATVLGELTNNGTINFTSETATLTVPTTGLEVNNETGNNDIKVVYENGTYKFIDKHYVAEIDGGAKYETLAEAATAAQDGETIQLLWNEGDAPISMAATFVGNKTITITGTANVDWSTGWFYVGRGGEDDGHVIFDNAKLTSVSNSSAHGINVSGRKKGSTDTYNGTVEFKNSTVVLDYLIQKNVMTLDNSTLTVKNGCSLTGRLANETENGELATSTTTLNNGSKLVVNGQNGMDLGYEGYGVLNIDATSTFEATENYGIAANGTMNVNGGNVKVAGTLTNNGTMNVATESNVEVTGNLNVNGTLNSAGNITANIVKAETATIQLNGGIYTTEPQDSWCAESYGAVELPDGTWFVRMLAGTQTREFANAGWYWFSTYIQDMEGQDGLTTLKSELDGKGKEIKSQHGGIRYYPAYDSWTNALTSLSTSEMYMINTTDPVTVEFNGDFVEYESRTINLVEGWNWIGYPVSQELDINVALKNLQAKEGDYIKGKNDDEDAWFVEGYGWWSETGDFKFKPGHGYMYLSQQATSFTFNAVGGEDVNTDVRRSVANNYHWNADATQYPSNMTMVAVVDGIDDNEYEVAAFVNGEVRGSARPAYFEPLDTYILVLTIHGDDVEEMTFKYYDLSTNTEYDLNNKINYSNDAIVGSIYEPYMLTRGTTGIGEAAMSQVNIYPNPTTTGTEINLEATCDKVEVFNALGVKVVEYQNVDTIDALETAGIYVIRITNNGNVQNCRLVVK